MQPWEFVFGFLFYFISAVGGGVFDVHVCLPTTLLLPPLPHPRLFRGGWDDGSMQAVTTVKVVRLVSRRVKLLGG